MTTDTARLEAARLALAQAEQDQATADAAVTVAREAHAMGGSRKDWARASNALARAQEACELARLRQRLAERAIDRERGPILRFFWCEPMTHDRAGPATAGRGQAPAGPGAAARPSATGQCS